MKEVKLARVPGHDRVDADKVPVAILNAVAALRSDRPDLDSSGSRPFDRFFEQEHKCRIKYADKAKAIPDRIIWPDERDYTLFVLKWSSV